MIISRIKNKDSIYYNLHAEQTISSTYFGAEIGIYVAELFDSTLCRINKDLDTILNANKHIVYFDGL